MEAIYNGFFLCVFLLQSFFRSQQRLKDVWALPEFRPMGKYLRTYVHNFNALGKGAKSSASTRDSYFNHSRLRSHLTEEWRPTVLHPDRQTKARCLCIFLSSEKPAWVSTILGQNGYLHWLLHLDNIQYYHKYNLELILKELFTACSYVVWPNCDHRCINTLSSSTPCSKGHLLGLGLLSAERLRVKTFISKLFQRSRQRLWLSVIIQELSLCCPRVNSVRRRLN